MNNRRLFRRVACLAAAAMVLTACGSSDGPAAETTEAGATEEASGLAGTDLSMWLMGDNASAFEELIAPFTEETGITVDVEAIPWDNVNERLTTAVASGEGPDVAQIGLSLLPTFVEAGALMDVSDLVGDHPALADDNFPSGVSADALNPDGGVHSFPWVSDTRVLFYRSDILGEAGFDEPPATWEEMHTVAQALSARGEDQYGYYIPQWDAPLPIAYTWQAGGDVINEAGEIELDTPAFHEAVDHYLAFHESGVVPTNGDFDQALGFITGTAPMLVSGPYLAGAIRDQAPELEGSWGVTTVPTHETGTSLFAGSNIGVWSGTEHADAAMALIAYLAEPETQLAWYEQVNELPAVSAALEQLKDGDDETVAVYAAQLEDARLLPLDPRWDAVGSEILDTLNAIALTGEDKDAALAELFASVDDQ